MQSFSALLSWVRKRGDLLCRESAHPSQNRSLQDQGGTGVRTAPRPTPAAYKVPVANLDAASHGNTSPGPIW